MKYGNSVNDLPRWRPYELQEEKMCVNCQEKVQVGEIVAIGVDFERVLGCSNCIKEFKNKP